MIKILIVTHGPLAQALKESSAMFFGSMSNDVETIGLYPTDNPEDLKEVYTPAFGTGNQSFVKR